MRYLFIFLLISGCALIEREKSYPGGNAGYLADKHVLFAKGHEQRVARFMVSLTFLAPLLAETAETPLDAKLSAERINAFYAGLDRLYAASRKCNFDGYAPPSGISFKDHKPRIDCTHQANTNKLELTAFAFETLSYEMSRSLTQAIKQVYDNIGVRKRARKLISLSPSDLLDTVLNLRRIVPIALKYFATYRDTAHIIADSVLTSCNGKDNEYNCNAVEKAVKTFATRRSEDVAHLKNVFEASFGSIDRGLNWNLQSQHYAALIFHIDRACARLANFQLQDSTITPTQCTYKDGDDNRAKKFLNTIQDIKRNETAG